MASPRSRQLCRPLRRRIDWKSRWCWLVFRDRNESRLTRAVLFKLSPFEKTDFMKLWRVVSQRRTHSANNLCFCRILRHSRACDRPSIFQLEVFVYRGFSSYVRCHRWALIVPRQSRCFISWLTLLFVVELRTFVIIDISVRRLAPRPKLCCDLCCLWRDFVAVACVLSWKLFANQQSFCRLLSVDLMHGFVPERQLPYSDNVTWW